MIKYLIQKEFLQIRRNAFLPRLIIIFPIMIMCVMPWVMNQEVRNIRVSVVDHDHSSLSARLVHSIEQSNYFRFRGMQPSYELEPNRHHPGHSEGVWQGDRDEGEGQCHPFRGG